MKIYSTTNPEYFYNTEEIDLIMNDKSWLKQIIYKPVLSLLYDNIFAMNNIDLSYGWDETCSNLVLTMSSNVKNMSKVVSIKIQAVTIAETLYNAIENNISIFKDPDLENILSRLAAKFLAVNNVITHNILYTCNGYIYNDNKLVGTFDRIKFGGAARSCSQNDSADYYADFNDILLFNSNYCIALNYVVLLDKTILSNAKQNIKIYVVIDNQRIALNFFDQYDIVILQNFTTVYDDVAIDIRDMGFSLCPKDLVLPVYDVKDNVNVFADVAKTRRKLIASQNVEDISEQFNFLL